MSNILNLESLKSAAALPLKAHPVPVYELGPGAIAYIAELSADERDARVDTPWLAHKAKHGKTDNVGLRAFLVAACWCDHQDRSFVAKTPEDVAGVAAELGKANGAAVTRMFDLAQKVNGMSNEAVENLEKNSPPRGDGSGTKPTT